MSKGPRSGRHLAKRRPRWVIIFEGPDKDERGRPLVRLDFVSHLTGIYPSAAAARRALEVSVVGKLFASWLLELNTGATEAP